MALTLGDNFSYQGAKPLDARLKYADLATMKAVADATMYDGCLAYCVATDKTYQWKSTNSVDATLGRWREFSSGGDSVSAGTGLELNNSEMSIKEFESGDMEEVMSPLPSVQPRYQKYSTEEQIVGSWISGEPLYQKTLTGNLPATINDGQRIDIPLGVTVDEVTAIHGSAKWVDSSTGGWSILPFTDGRAIVNNKNQCYFVLYSYGNVISMVIGGPNRTYYHSQPYRLTVQYTKTTD